MKFFSLLHVERAILGGPRDRENGTKPNVVQNTNKTRHEHEKGTNPNCGFRCAVRNLVMVF